MSPDTECAATSQREIDTHYHSMIQIRVRQVRPAQRTPMTSVACSRSRIGFTDSTCADRHPTRRRTTLVAAIIPIIAICFITLFSSLHPIPAVGGAPTPWSISSPPSTSFAPTGPTPGGHPPSPLPLPCHHCRAVHPTTVHSAPPPQGKVQLEGKEQLEAVKRKHQAEQQNSDQNQNRHDGMNLDLRDDLPIVHQPTPSGASNLVDLDLASPASAIVSPAPPLVPPPNAPLSPAAPSARDISRSAPTPSETATHGTDDTHTPRPAQAIPPTNDQHDARRLEERRHSKPAHTGQMLIDTTEPEPGTLASHIVLSPSEGAGNGSDVDPNSSHSLGSNSDSVLSWSSSSSLTWIYVVLALLVISLLFGLLLFSRFSPDRCIRLRHRLCCCYGTDQDVDFESLATTEFEGQTKPLISDAENPYQAGGRIPPDM